MSLPWSKDTSKLNNMELVKLKKDGLDILNDIKHFAERGFDAITSEDLDLLKWAGVYIQKPKTAGFFMMRVKVPGGIIDSEQLRTLADIARDSGRNLIDLTTRQAIQFHWLTIDKLPFIFERLEKVGLTSIEACGDCPRTVVGNPLAGIDPNEVIDVRPIIQQVHQFFQHNRDFSNLPRKFKISISGDKFNSGHAEINDLAFTPAVKAVNGQEVSGFHVRVGGGLSAKPHLAQQLDVFVLPEEVLKVAIGVATIFRDHGYRENRRHARLKFLVADWGVVKFREELLKIVGPLPECGRDMTLGWNGGYFYGVQKQVQEDLSYIGLSVPVGRMDADQVKELARIAEQYGNGTIRTCNSQNIIVPNVPSAKVRELLKEKILEYFTPFPGPFLAYAVACTGSEFCNLALVETKRRMRELSEYLAKHVDNDTTIRIHLAGCQNSCGQQQIADIGIRGTGMREGNKVEEAFEFFIGGVLGPIANFGSKLEGRIPGNKLNQFVEYLIKFYNENKNQEESFNAFVQRVGISAFQHKMDEFPSWHGTDTVKG